MQAANVTGAPIVSFNNEQSSGEPLKTFRVNRQDGTVEFNIDFLFSLTTGQLSFATHWVKYIKQSVNFLKADELALKGSLLQGYTREDICRIFEQLPSKGVTALFRMKRLRELSDEYLNHIPNE